MSRLTHGSARLSRGLSCGLTRLDRETALPLVLRDERVSRFRTVAAFTVFRWRV